MRYECKKIFGRKSISLLLLLLLLLGISSCLWIEAAPAAPEASAHAASLERVIRLAELNKKNLPPDSYLARYQDEVIFKYGALLARQITPEPVSGYDSFLLYKEKGLFLLMAAALFGSMPSLAESDHGMSALHAISRCGKRVYRRKAVWIVLVTTGGTILFSLAQLSLCLVRFGAEGLLAPLLSVPGFALCPYRLSVLAYLGVQIGTLALLACLVALSAELVGRLFGSHLLSLLAGLLPIGLYVFGENGFDTLFVRYRALNLFGKPVPLVNAVMLLLHLVPIGLLFLLWSLPSREGLAPLIVRGERRCQAAMRALSERLLCLLPKRSKRKSQSLFGYELKKLPALSLTLVLLLLGAAGHTAFRESLSTPYERLYREVCLSFSGELTPEKERRIADTLASAREILDIYETKRKERMEGTLSQEDYQAYLERYYKAEQDAYVFSRLSAQVAHIRALRESGREAYLVYETGWQRLLFAPYDPFLYFAVLILLSGLFSGEQKHGMEAILKTTRNGRRRLGLIKLACALLLTTLLCLVCGVIELGGVMHAYPLPGASYPAISLSAVPVKSEASLLGYLLLVLARRLLGYLLLGGSVWLAAKGLKRVYFVIPILLTLTLLPHHLWKYLPTWLDLLKFLS